MNKFPFLLARRFFGTMASDKTSARLAIICFISIALGSCALLVTTAIVNGFRRVTNDVMQSVHPDLTLQSFDRSPLSYTKIGSVLNKEFASNCITHTPIATESVLVQSKNSDDISHLATIEGINPKTDSLVRKLPLSFEQNNNDLAHILAERKIIIGKTLAEELNVTRGSSLSLLHATNLHLRSQSITFEKESVTVGGIFKTGLDDIDRALIICSLDLFDELFPESGITQIGIRCAPHTDLKTTAQELGKRFKLDAYAWHELYPAFNEALVLENYALIIIIILITTITSLTIASLLSLFLFQKRHTLAILRAMGIPQRLITQSFLLVGAVLVVGAQLTGCLLAIAISLLLEKGKLIALPDAYYIPYLPAELDIVTVATILTIGSIVGFGICWLTARQNTSLSVMTALKSE